MTKFSVLILVFLSVTGCQQKPTKSIDETANVFRTETVLVDTRSTFLFTSSHIKGSVNLETADFLLLKDPRAKKRIFDPDLNQTIERLAKKGIHPTKKVLLLSDTKNSDENKKWTWLLAYLEIEDIESMSLDEFRKQFKNARYADPDRALPWTLKLSSELQDEFILKKAPNCFVVWSPKKCEKNLN